jgi:hypothetical protein
MAIKMTAAAYPNSWYPMSFRHAKNLPMKTESDRQDLSHHYAGSRFGAGKAMRRSWALKEL